jgi:NADPH-dependent curcumin reductase CurA
MVSARKKVVRCKAVILATYPKGWVKEENMKVVEMEVDLTLKEGYIALKLAYISLDPYYRGCMQEDKRGLYFSPFQLGKVNCTSYATAKLGPRALTSRPSSYHIVLQTVQKICEKFSTRLMKRGIGY